MKKIALLFIAFATLTTACKKDETTTETVDIATQQQLDTDGIKNFLESNYVDSKGRIKAFSSTDTSDDNYKKLSELNPVTLNSGVIYIMLPGAQPDPGKAIGATDIIHIMVEANAYIAKSIEGKTILQGKQSFRNTLAGSGVPDVDPSYYYAKQDILTASGKGREYFEIKGFKEALQNFKAFNKADSEDYQMQGIIIVPSKAAFGREPNYYNAQDRTFVFNFQVYKTEPRP